MSQSYVKDQLHLDNHVNADDHVNIVNVCWFSLVRWPIRVTALFLSHTHSAHCFKVTEQLLSSANFFSHSRQTLFQSHGTPSLALTAHIISQPWQTFYHHGWRQGRARGGYSPPSLERASSTSEGEKLFFCDYSRWQL